MKVENWGITLTGISKSFKKILAKKVGMWVTNDNNLECITESSFFSPETKELVYEIK